MLLLKDPDKAVLRKVEPKISPAANRNHRVGWTFSQAVRLDTTFEGRSSPARVLMEIVGKEPRKVWPMMARSDSQSRAISPAKVRSSATFGTSIYPITASEIAYSWSRKMRGTKKTANNHRPSNPRLIQGNNDVPGLVARSVSVDVVIEVVTLKF